MQPKRIIDLDEKLKSSMLDVRGPSPERLERAGEQYSIGGDERSSVRVYHFLDSPLDRLYSRLARKASEDETTRLGIEYAALRKYQRLFVESGMIGSVGSVDPNRTYSPNPAGRSFLASTERQQDCRDEYRRAVIHLNRHPEYEFKQYMVVEDVVCKERSLEKAGFRIGKKSQTRAIEGAQEILRDAGYRLAKMWGITR